jgi:hypothetical protein
MDRQRCGPFFNGLVGLSFVEEAVYPCHYTVNTVTMLLVGAFSSTETEDIEGVQKEDLRALDKC